MSTGTLATYWLGELPPDAEAAFEEHFFGCAQCSARLSEFVRQAQSIKSTARAGALMSFVSPAFVERVRATGAQVREYRLEPGGSVMCTVAPEDDLVASHLHAPLEGVQRLDIEVHDSATGNIWHLEDIPFDPAAGEIVYTPGMAMLRGMGRAIQTVQLLAVAAGADGPKRKICDYTFNHSPFIAAED